MNVFPCVSEVSTVKRPHHDWSRILRDWNGDIGDDQD